MSDEGKERVFQQVCAYDDETVLVLSMNTDDLETRAEKSFAHLWYKEKWYLVKLAIEAIDVCMHSGVDGLERNYLGARGVSLRYRKNDGFKAEFIDPSDDGPSELVLMKRIKLHEGSLYASGMARRVYRRSLDEEGWAAVDGGCFQTRQERTEATGFCDFVFDDSGAMYAVGYQGEIWIRSKKGNWSKQNSPTNVFLSTIVAIPGVNEFLCAGLRGILVRGSKSTGWRIIENSVKVDFWSSIVFKDRVFLASDKGIFLLNEDESLRAVMISKEKITTRYLSVSENYLWSVGDQDIFKSKDGQEWIRIPNPE
jgi:hypothetical protein